MRKRILMPLLAVLLLCSGCAGGEKPYRVETVVWIPVNPNQAPVTGEETVPAEALEETELATEKPAQPSDMNKPGLSTGSFSGGNVSTGTNHSSNQSNTSDKNNSTGKPAKPAETEPPSTAPPQTEPPETEPPATERGNEPYDISGYAVGSLEYAIRDRVNSARGEEGVPELGLDARLSAIASCRAYELSQLWSHTRPDGRGYSTVLADYGYSAAAVTELLAYATGSGDGTQMAEQWLASDSHRARLLSTSVSTAGIGIYRANGYTYVCCLLVG